MCFAACVSIFIFILFSFIFIFIFYPYLVYDYIIIIIIIIVIRAFRTAEFNSSYSNLLMYVYVKVLVVYTTH